VHEKRDGAENMVRIGEKRGFYRIFWGNLKEKHHSEELGLDGRIILNGDFKQSGGKT